MGVTFLHASLGVAQVGWGEVLIHEIMSDPNPRAGIFLGEYIELYNRSDHAVAWADLVLELGSRQYILDPGENTGPDSLAAGHYACRELKGIPNGSGRVVLYNTSGGVIHAVEYAMPWDGPSWKEEGGWSLEAVDAGSFCQTSFQWQFSVDPSGGTPGQVNSVEHPWMDLAPPVFLFAGIQGDSLLVLHFSETLGEPGTSAAVVHIQAGSSWRRDARFSLPFAKSVEAEFPKNVLGRPAFRIQVPALPDCAGNVMEASQVLCGAPSPPESGKVVINEIMFEPENGNPEYIELYHAGVGFTDVQELKLGICKAGEKPQKLLDLTSASRILGKGEYLVLTPDVVSLRRAHQLPLSGCFVERTFQPAMSASGGEIYLCDRAGNTVDRAFFSRDLHMQGMDLMKGISLERIRPGAPGMDPLNWHSAASISNYATPGERNSQAMSDGSAAQLLELEPRVFSPDNDGYRDVQGLFIQGLEAGMLINLRILDMRGSLVRTLANNHLAAPELSYRWDGQDEQGYLVNAGFYLVHLEVLHPEQGRILVRRMSSGVVYP